MLHIPASWYFDTSVTYPQWFRRVKFVVISPRFVQPLYLWNIAIQLAVDCYNSWANLRCSGCSPLGENYCEMGLLKAFKWMKLSEFLIEYNELFVNKSTFVQVMAWCQTSDKICPSDWDRRHLMASQSQNELLHLNSYGSTNIIFGYAYIACLKL